MSPSRPRWCPDPTCRPLSTTPGCHTEQLGISGFCVGRCSERVTERHGVRHVNDAHLCFASPVRGVTMLELNQTDFDLLARLALHALVDYEPERPFNSRWYT
ncbi:MAG: hypothetical protein ACRDJN_29640, partial [Chloroflexota bacterium]